MRIIALLLLAAISGATMAQDSSPTYQKAPAAMQRILDAPPLPSMVLSPARDYYFLVQGESYPTICLLYTSSTFPVHHCSGLEMQRKNKATPAKMNHSDK